MAISLYDHQLDALGRMKNGCILNGGVGSGKSRTGLAYYFTQEGGELSPYKQMKPHPKDLYIITTAQKRDNLEWEGELVPFLLSNHPERNTLYGNKVIIDSWNNISKYKDVTGAFFIFDEDRVTGSGAWVKAFLKIAKVNKWIILSATAGDSWLDFIPVFVANGFYKNRTEFCRRHVVYSRFAKYPKVDNYLETGHLLRLKDSLLIDMDFDRKTVAHHEDVFVSYDIPKYKDTARTRTDPYHPGYVPCTASDPKALCVGIDILLEEVTPIMPGWYYEPNDGDYVKLVYKPLKNASELCYVWRKIVNTDESRQVALLEILEEKPRVIVFYNFDYERDILYDIAYGAAIEVAEWSGHKHQPIPDSDRWMYLVQYTAGNAGWNCIKTDTIVFYSQNYSYKVMQQAAGRIDRLNTPYTDLYYYHLKTRSGIDLAISKALKNKKTFNETRWVKKGEKKKKQ